MCEPQEVRSATDDYRQEMDVLGDFLEECCLTGPDHLDTLADLYKRYEEWCDDGAVPKRERLGKRRFSAAMAERGFEKGRDPSTRAWTFYGVMVRPKTAPRRS